MKKRARIVSGLAALGVLAALFLAPIAEASLTRTSVAERAVEAPALTLAAAQPDSSEFSLFEGTDLTAAVAESGSPESFHPLAAVSLLSKDGAEAPLVSADELSYPKTRYRVYGLLGTPILGELSGVTLELHWRSASFSCGLASGTVGWLSQDPMGDKDSPNLYGFVGARPHEKTDPLGLSWTTFSYGVAEGAINLVLGTAQTIVGQYLPAPLNNVNLSVNLTQPGKAMLSASVPTPLEQVKSASVVFPVGETLGRFGGNAFLTVQGWFDSAAPQDYLDETHADLGRDTPGSVLALAPLPKVIRAVRSGEAAAASELRAGASRINLADPAPSTPAPRMARPKAPTKGTYADDFRAVSDTPAGHQVHHTLFQRYAAEFKALGINIHEARFLRGVDPKVHARITAASVRLEKQLGRRLTAPEVMDLVSKYDTEFAGDLVHRTPPGK